MRNTWAGWLIVAVAAWAADARAIVIDTVPVGNVGNGPDVNAFGAVNYAYRIGKTEVTVGQYSAFLNAVAVTDTYGLYNSSMTDANIAGILQSGTSGSYSYSAIGSANSPVSYVNWGNAARFSNWLHNGQPTGAQSPSTTEDGSYALYGAISTGDLNLVARRASATWVIPNEDEWYKAAYHQPAAQGGDADDYWTYPTLTNTEPNSDQPPGELMVQTNVANFFRNDSVANGYNDGYAVTGSTSLFFNRKYLADAGAYASSPGPYGTFDQGGNLFEWNEALFSGTSRGMRGGSWNYGSTTLLSSFRSGGTPSVGYDLAGFRVAIAPEPSSGLLAIVGFCSIWCWKKRLASAFQASHR